MQTLDGLGAGFTLASHDLDIRGAGNLVGAEQSGYIREVGAELYQHMLEAAIAALKAGHKIDVVQQGQSPQISLNMPVSIPESYVPDMGLRLGLYRRGAVLKSLEELQGFALELEDRFGPVPVEVENLLTVLELKIHCMDLGIAKLDVGEKGIVLSFARAPNLARLVAFINEQKGTAKMRADERLVILRSWPNVAAQCQGLRSILVAMRAFEIGG
jgi:transcription-repair coupling factor (superfamily II helicase)